MTFVQRMLLLATASTVAFANLHAQNATITDQEAHAKGVRIETTMMNGDPSELDNFLDFDGLVKRIQQSSEIARNPDFVTGMRQSFDTKLKFLGQRFLKLMNGGSFRLLKSFSDQGAQHLLFRSYENPGFNYIDFRLVRVGDSIRTDDYFAYNVEDWISGTLASLANSLAASAESGKEIETVDQLKSQYQKKDYAAVKATFEKADTGIRNNKLMSLLYVHACRALGDSAYLPALTYYTERFPNAPSGCIMEIDLAFLKKKYDLGLAAVNKLDSLVGGDPFINFYRGTFLYLLGRKDESLTCHEKAFQYDPSIKTNTIDLAGAYLRAGQHDKAVAVLEAYKKTHSYREGDLTDFYNKHPDVK